MNTEPHTKISILREHMAAGKWQKAISIAAKFPRLGEHRETILSAHGAYTNPHFYTQMYPSNPTTYPSFFIDVSIAPGANGSNSSIRL